MLLSVKILFDNLIVGKEITLGFTYFINGKELSRPLYEIPEHYIEIPEIEEEVLPVDSDNLKDLLLIANYMVIKKLVK